MSEEKSKTKPKNVVTREDGYPKRKRRNNMERKRFSPASYSKPEWSPATGRGAVISSIPAIAAHLSSCSKGSDFLTTLHFIMYSRAGKAKEIKKNVGNFSGLQYTYEDDDDKNKFIEDKLAPKSKATLVRLYHFFNLKAIKTISSAKKKAICDALFEFLDEPSKDKTTKKKQDFEADPKKPRSTRRTRSRSSSRGRSDSSSSDSSSSESEKEDRRRSSSRSRKSRGSSKSDDDKSDREERKSNKRKRDDRKSSSSSSSKRRKSSKSDTDKSDRSDSEAESKSRRRKSKRSKEVSVVDDLKDKLKSGECSVLYAPNNRHKCRDVHCKKSLDEGQLVIARSTGHGDKPVINMFHPDCFFEAQRRFRDKNDEHKVTSTKDLIGFGDLKEKHQKLVEKNLKAAMEEDEKKEEKKRKREEKGATDSESEDEEEYKKRVKRQKRAEEEKEKEEKDKKKDKKDRKKDDKDKEEDKDDKKKDKEREDKDNTDKSEGKDKKDDKDDKKKDREREDKDDKKKKEREREREREKERESEKKDREDKDEKKKERERERSSEKKDRERSEKKDEGKEKSGDDRKGRNENKGKK